MNDQTHRYDLETSTCAGASQGLINSTPTFFAHLIRDSTQLRAGEPEKWNVEFDGNEIVHRSRDPEHEACRALQAKGLRGRVTFVHGNTGTLGLTMGINWGAERSTVESDSHHALRSRKYTPSSGMRAPPESD